MEKMTRTYEDLLAWQKAHQLSIQNTSYFLNSYIKGVVNKNGIKD